MSETVIVGVLFLIVVAATTFYLYSRLLYSERKISLMENILLDIKMAMEMEREVHGHMNPNTNGLVEPKFEDVTAKDDTEYYNSVLENAAIESEELKPTPDSSASPLAPAAAVPVDSAKHDELTRDELVAIAEKKGLRVTKRATKQQILSLLRDADKNSSALPETGTDGPVGGTTGSVEGASLLSGELESSTPE